MRKVLLEKREAIVKHLKSYRKVFNGQEDVEAAVTRFIINEIGRGNKEFAAQLLKRESKLTKEDLDEMVVLAKEIAEKITLPANVILKNISIDPRLQENMYLKLSKMVDPPILIHPSSPEFSDNLYKVLLLINTSFKRNYDDERILSLTKLTDSWLKETTLKRIIELELDNKKLSGEDICSKDVINNTIESIIKDINNILGYEFCRDINCYEDILSYVMKRTNRNFKKVENLSYYIEVGAHKPITIDLLNKGIPRIIALIISSKLPVDSYNEENYKKAIHDAKNEIPSILFKEIFPMEMQFNL